MTVKSEQIIVNAVETFDVEHQLDIAIEEMSELTKEICKLKRYGAKPEILVNITEEMADVYIMLRQMELYFKNAKFVDDVIENKLKRLSKAIFAEKLNEFERRLTNNA